MPIFYPDNQKRADRLMQLMDQMTNMQKTASDEYQSIKNAEDGMLDSFNEIMKKQGLATLDELLNWIKSLMPESAREEYEKVIKACRDLDDYSNIILLSTGMVFTIATTAGLVLNAALYMKAAASIKALQSFAFGVRVLVTQGVEAGLKILTNLRTALKTVAAELKTTTTFGRVVGVVSTIAKVLDWVSFGATLITLIAQIIIEKEQRDELIKNIQIAVVNRINVSFFGAQLKKATEHVVAMNTYLKQVAKYGKDNPVIQDMAKDIGQGIEDSMDLVTVDGEISSWSTLDKNNGAYTADDLSAAVLKERVEEEIKKFEEEVNKSS